MTQQFLEEARRELVNGHSKKKHPFRYFTLATLNGLKPKQRTVVLRKILQDDRLLIYTDARTQKVSDLRENPEVSALFYHPKKLMQLRVEGEAKIITDSKLLKSYWNNIPEHSRKDYVTSSDPGTAISNPDQVDYLENEHHFCAIHIHAQRIEYLRLKRPNHLRVLFTKLENDWTGQFLVP